MRLVISAQEMENFIENVETPLLLQISGKFTCQLKPAYAVVLAIFEEVKVDNGTDFLRISGYVLSDFKGAYSLTAKRHYANHPVHLNFIHSCLPSRLKQVAKNCYAEVRIPLRTGRRENKDVLVDHIELYQMKYQLGSKCEPWLENDRLKLFSYS
uniref:SHS2_Rpb7-N domain-containing protein n=1 Tax=Ascaris lumbricoides TaxID=6252 RepID=A0A0M3I0D4_ASCLU